MGKNLEDINLIEKYKLQGSLLEFTQIFYRLRTGRMFTLSEPSGRESHYLTICKALVKVLDGETNRLIINVPPRYGKTELLIHFIAWAICNYPDSNFIYVSYSHSLAKKQTQTIREIITLPHYRKMFDVELKDDTQAKDNFELKQGGSVYAAGSGGTITGRGAGINGCDRFGGCIVIDDIHKPSEVTSDTMRESVNNWYFNTLQSRINGPNTPIIFIGQRLHEDDLASNLIKSGDWDLVIIPSIDDAGNILHPTMHDRNSLLKMKEQSPYEFASQYQQDPQPSGGGIFKPEWFYLMDNEPDILATFITADTAETDKDYNDATVFSFWGIYKIDNFGRETDTFGLHWLDCKEIRVEPKDLKDEFLEFYLECMNHRVKPKLAAIEKKSSGVTLLSVLKDLRGITVRQIERTRSSGNKTSRFLEIQPYVARKEISFTIYSRHIDLCINHMKKITANNTHRDDDIADTLYDAVKLGLIDKSVTVYLSQPIGSDDIVNRIARKFKKTQALRNSVYGNR